MAGPWSLILLYALVMARLTPIAVLLAAAFARPPRRFWPFGVACVLALLIVPMHSVPSHVDWHVASLIMTVFRELMIGLALGFGFAILLAGLQIVGALLSQLTGATWTDLTEANVGVHGSNGIQRYFTLIAFAVLVVSGGHRQLVDVLLHSFAAVPPGGMVSSSPPRELLNDLLLQSVSVGIRAAAPIAFCLLVSTVVIALLGRSMPMFGAYGMGIALNMVVLLLVSCVSIETLATVYQEHWTMGLERLLEAVQLAGSQP